MRRPRIYYTPLQTARKIRRDQNVGALSPLPFACIVANCSVWVLYGVIGRDWVPMVASNAVGVASGAYCLGVFIRFAKPPAKTFAASGPTAVDRIGRPVS